MFLGYDYSQWLAFFGFSFLGAAMIIVVGLLLIGLIDAIAKSNKSDR